MQQHPGVDIVGTNMWTTVRGKTRFVRDIRLQPMGTRLFRVSKEDIMKENWIFLSSSMVRSSVVNRVKGFRVCDFEDWDFWKRCLQESSALFYDVPLVIYDVHSSKEYQYGS
jgi:hypothetical protein